MMTPREFMTKLQTCKTQQSLIILGIIGISTLAIVAFYTRFTGFVRGVFVVFWIALIITVGQFISAFLLRRHGLVCSSCGQLLEKVEIVQTHKCPKCQMEVIRDA
jgi:hypothetical protein